MHASILQIISINMSTKFDLRLFPGPLDQPLEVLVIFTLESWSHHIRMHLKNPPPSYGSAVCYLFLHVASSRGSGGSRLPILIYGVVESIARAIAQQ